MQSRSSGLAARFRFAERGTTPLTEVRAGFVTFLTMAYILFVNAQILADAGIPRDGVVLATAIASAVACLAMGLLADYPFALAPGMGLNAYFAYAVVGGMGLTWPQALAAVFVAGALFLVLSMGGARRAVLEAIPESLALATTGGIGLFLAFIGLEKAGIVADHPVTLVTLGDLGRPEPLIALGGILLLGVLTVRRFPGALLLGILVVTAICWITGVSPTPDAWFGLPRSTDTVMALDFGVVGQGAFLTAVLAFLFVDLFDTAGTLMGVGRLGGFLDERGQLPRSDRAFLADAIGTTVGATLGTSPVTTYIESATGIEDGGRTGLTAITVAGLFLSALLFTPVFVAVPAVATAPALVLVGAFMMRGLGQIPWHDPGEALPAFLVLTVMPLTFSIANGIAAGIFAWVVIALGSGRHREIPPLLFLLGLVLVAFFALT